MRERSKVAWPFIGPGKGNSQLIWKRKLMQTTVIASSFLLANSQLIWKRKLTQTTVIASSFLLTVISCLPYFKN